MHYSVGALARTLRLTVGACMFISKLPAQQSPPSDHLSAKALQEEFVALAYRRIHAFDEGDTLDWKELVGDAYFISNPYGGVSTKAQQVASFSPRSPGYENDFRIEDVSVIPLGSAAVMNYRIIEHESWDGQKVTTAPLRKTDVYGRFGNRWLIVASHESFVPVPPKYAPLRDAQRRAYSGRYRLTRSIVYDVAADSGGLLIHEVGSSERTRLLQLSDSTFVFEGSEYRATFSDGRSGKTKLLILHLAGYDVRAHRIAARPE